MGFLDKAKKLAEQAQEKLDEDKHGRPIPPATPPATSPPPAPPEPEAPPEPSKPPGEDRNFPSHAPPTLTSGDPLAG
jgi:hypothetical protein